MTDKDAVLQRMLQHVIKISPKATIEAWGNSYALFLDVPSTSSIHFEPRKNKSTGSQFYVLSLQHFIRGYNKEVQVAKYARSSGKKLDLCYYRQTGGLVAMRRTQALNFPRCFPKELKRIFRVADRAIQEYFSPISVNFIQSLETDA